MKLQIRCFQNIQFTYDAQYHSLQKDHKKTMILSS